MYTLIIVAIVLILFVINNRNFFAIYLLNYILGNTLILLFFMIIYNKDLGQGGVIIALFDSFYFSILFFLSLLYFVFGKTSGRLLYFILTAVFIYGFILGYFISSETNILYKAIILFISFFPLHIIAYFKLKRLNKI